MFSSETYAGRRAELRRRLGGGGVVLLPGNDEAPANYRDNAYHFRQDSTFLYFFGIDHPGLFGVMDLDSGEDVLFGDDLTVEDIIWTGPQPSVAELGARAGVRRSAPLSELSVEAEKAVRTGRRMHFLPPYRAENRLRLSALTGIKQNAIDDYVSVDLIIACAAMREVKSAEELAELERGFEIGYRMHTTAMRMCVPGAAEREIAGAIEGAAMQYGWGVSFHSIVSQHGETLHNHSHDGILESGRLLLVDAGAETVMNYCSDHTRTFPVSGRFTQKQKDVYEIVLNAHDHVLRTAAPGMYRDLHAAAYRVMAEGLIGLGLMRGNAEEAVAAGAMEMFMPHGLGHGMGLDVHDCEEYGERGMRDFSAVAARADEVDTCIMRSRWRLRPGTVMTDEPGIYFIPALIEKWRAEGRCTRFVDFGRLKDYYDFGGIRIEDDLVITETGCRIIGHKTIPVSVAGIEEYMAGRLG